MSGESDLSDNMSRQTCHEWGTLFASPWPELVERMAGRAAQMGLAQDAGDATLIWKKDGETKTRWLFVDDPTDIEAIRAIYNDDENVQAPNCFIVVKQPDPSDVRGDIIYDIFRLSPTSYLWHFFRVYTPPIG